MKLAQIVPPQWSTIYPPGEYHMVLAHWVLENPEYVQAIKHAPSGGYTIVDNGLFEGAQVSIPDLNEACLKVDADEVVLPDVMGDARETLGRSWAALGKLNVARVMFVPQGKTPDAVMTCLDAWLKKWEGSEFQKRYALAIGLTSGGRPPVPGLRREVLNKVVARGLGHPIHLLGIPSPEEFLIREAGLARELNIRGVDSSIAFALGAQGKLLTRDTPKTHLGPPSDYESLNTYRRRLVSLNQRILVEWVEHEADARIPTFWIRQTAAKWLKYYAEGFATLETVMSACGMPKGRYALLRQRRREKYVRQLTRGDALWEHESEVKI